MISIASKEIQYKKGVGGYRASTPFLQWSKAMSLYQKSIRRKNYEDCMWATVNIYNVLLEDNKSNWTNFINRVLIISCEDVKSDPIFLNRLFELTEQFKKLKNKHTAEELAVVILSISNTLINAKHRGRSVSYLKHEMLSLINNGEFVSDISKDVWKNGDFHKDLKESGSRWKACISLSNDIFNRDRYTKSGTFTAKSRDIVVKKFTTILSEVGVKLNYKSISKWTITNDDGEKEKSLSNLFNIWIEKVKNHKEHFIFIIKAFLYLDADIVEYDRDFLVNPEEAYEIVNKYINMKRDVPSYALDCHTGRFKKGSNAGNKHFAEVGSVCFEEKLEVPVEFKDNYLSLKLNKSVEVEDDDYLEIEMCVDEDDYLDIELCVDRDIKTKPSIPDYIRIGRSKRRLEVLNSKKIIYKVRAQLPCGDNRPGTWIVQTDDMKYWWVKEEYKVKHYPKIQMEFDKIKARYGVIPLNMEWNDDGYMYCPSVYGKDFKTTYNRGVKVIDVVDTRLSRIETLGEDKVIGEIMKVFALRSIFDISDTNLTNVMLYKGDVISYDEMNTRKNQLKDTVWKFLFVMVPNKNKRDQLSKWLSNNKDEYISLLESWTFNGIDPVFKDLYKRRDHLVSLLRALNSRSRVK